MRKIRLLLPILLLACICACNNKPYPQSIQVADSLVYSNPDSAITLLEQLKGSMAFEPKVTQMYYRLLTIKAKDKAYITHTSDSLIKTVVEYYEEKKDKERLPEAYYYAGRVYRDLGDAPRALDYFQKALESSTDSKDYKLIGMIHNQTGMLYLYQDIYKKALTSFQKAYHYAKLSKDSTRIVFYLRDIGRAFTGLNKVDSTLYYYKEAEKNAHNINNNDLIGIINQEVVNIYTQLGDYQEAYNALQTSLCATNRFQPPYYAVFADLYYKTGKIDSALHYYTKLISTDKCNYYHKQAGYEGLGKIARQQGKYADALNYMDKYLIYTDSIQRENNVEAVQKTSALYNYNLQEKEKNDLKITTQEQKLWIISLSASIIIILMIILTINFLHRQKETQAERKEEKLQEIAKEHYLNSQEYIAENVKRIEELREKTQKTENKKNELEKNLEESEKELLELTNKQIETKQKIQTLSEAALKESQIYKDFYHVAGMTNSKNISEKSKITQEDWDELIALIDKTYNNFTWRLQSLYPQISEQEVHLCVLSKISMPPLCIANLLARSKQAISSSRKKLYEVTHNQSGKPNMWDDFIRNF